MREINNDAAGGRGVASSERRRSGPSRRDVLRLSGVAAVAGGAVAAASGSASAGEVKECGDWPDSPDGYPTIDLAEDVPPTWDWYPAEVCIYAHGWKGRETRDDQAYALDLELADAGYHEVVVAATWDSDTLNFWGAEGNADEAGTRLGRWIRQQFGGTQTTVRLVGHSLGGRLSLNAIDELDGDVVLETVALLGAAVEDDSVCDDGRFADGIRDSAVDVYNYHSHEDATVCTIYDLSTLGSGVGCAGADCGGWFTDGETPDNYHDVDVTASVPDHCAYFDPIREAGCIDRVVADFRE
ncbi:alpha/beta hydrolase [Halovivax sp.]|uniref:alpha/beta hydrolase n=1 Tax=Halovivax sp. TaxID=1935978 RepID=UPI0025B88D75|nr:alpha/beta hydrolase [Halovivax sp.]